MNAPAICPRCRHTDLHTVARSPLADVWEYYVCQLCWYGFRSTEQPQATDPDRYPVAFRLSRDTLLGL